MDNTLHSTASGGGEHGEVGATQVAAVTGTPIGQISAATQPVHVTHPDGSTEDLGVGGQIYANDTVKTDADGEVEITFVDGTHFSLGGNAEMQIDKLIYDPSGSDNSLAVSVVQGAFVFVTGAIAGAPGEGMEVTTPAGGIGVRGTSVGGHYTQGPEGWVIALLKDANGHVGKVVVYNSKGEVVLDELFESTKLIDPNTPPTVPVILTKEQIEALFGVPLELLPEIHMQIELEGQRGELDTFQTAAGGPNSGGPNHGSHFYTFGLANFVFGVTGGTVPATALGDSGPLGGSKLVYDTPGGPQDPHDKQFQDSGGPFGMALGGGHIPENSPFGTVAGFVAAILGGPPNATYTYSLVDQEGFATFRVLAFAALGEASPAFEIDPATGIITVHNPELMDFETTPDFFLTIRATNTSGQFVDVPFQVHLEDVNDNAPVIDPHEPIDLAENSAAGTVVGQVTAHDADTTGEATVFSIVEESDPNHYFAIDPATGQITLTAAGAASGLLDYETELNKIVLQVIASDGTNTSGPTDVEIDITDVNEAQWSISGSTFVSEGGTTTYTVSYTGVTLAEGESMTIDVQTQPGSAEDGSDYTGLTTTITFIGGGATSATVEVSTIDDTVIEGDEDYTVAIGNPSHGNVAGSGEVTTTIEDGNDTILSWQIEGNSTVEEGQDAVYTVSYTGATLADGQTATVTVQTHEGSAQEGADKDFGGVDLVLTFTGGDVTAQTVSVETFSDSLTEGTEDYSVDLISNVGTTGSGVTTEIVDPPPPMVWTLSGDSGVNEGSSAIYIVSYSGGSLAPGELATITLDTSSGTASEGGEGGDFDGAHVVLTFTGGEDTAQTVTLSTHNDTVIEGTEDYTVSIHDPSAGSVAGDGQITTQISDNDTVLSWSVTGDSTGVEGDSVTYTVSYGDAVLADGHTVTVTVQTGPGSATEGEDYGAVDTVLTFTGGDATSQTIAVELFNDTQVESSENYSVDLQSDVGQVGSGVTTEILDPPPPLEWSIQGLSTVTEGDAATYTVGYSGGTLATGEIATVTIDTSPGTAGENQDYLGVHTVLTFTGGEAATQTLEVATIGDNNVEDTETYTVSITQVDHGDIASGQTQTAIIDNDVPPDNGNLDGTIATGTNHSEQPVILTFVDENPLTEGDPLHAYSRLLVIGGEASITEIDTDAGFDVDDSRTYRAALEFPPDTIGSHLDIHGVTLEGVDLGPRDNVTIGYDNNGTQDSVPGDPVGITGLLDPGNGDALQPMQPSEDGNGSNDTIFGSKGSFNYLFGADGNDTIEGSTDPEILNGGNAGFNGYDSVDGGGGDDIIVYHPNSVIDGGFSGFDILRVDQGALELYQSDKSGDPLETSSTIDLTNASVYNIDMILITEDADADSKRGTSLELDAATADRMTRSAGSESDSSTNLYIVGSKGDHLTLDDFGGDWVDGNGDIPGIQPVGHVDDGHGQAFDIYQVATDNFSRTTNVYVDTDIQVTVDQASA